MANKVVVDTSYLIELLDRGRRGLLRYILDREVLIPYVVMFEYLYGYRVIGRDVSRRKRVLEDLGSIVWMDQDLLLRLIELRHEAEEKGIWIPEADLIVIAVASVNNAPILTFDKKDFKKGLGGGVEVVIPGEE